MGGKGPAVRAPRDDEGDQGDETVVIAEHRTQAQRRQQTRQAIVDAALTLSAAGASFDSLSIRRVTAEAGVAPSVFYRYFSSMDELGLTVIDESYGRLRLMLEKMPFDDRAGPTVLQDVVAILVSHVERERRYLTFIASQRTGGNRVLRAAARAELRLVYSETATHLGRLTILRPWSVSDVTMLATVIVNTMMAAVDALLEALSDGRGPSTETAVERVAQATERQLRLVFLAVAHWRS